jgi:sugar-specific transcriptional regulator TrmB
MEELDCLGGGTVPSILALSARSGIEQRLTADAVAVYKYLIAHPNWQPTRACADTGLAPELLTDALDVLASLHLVRPSADPNRAWDPVSPQSALAELLADEEAELNIRQVHASKVHGEVSRLIPSYQEARRAGESDEPVEVIQDLNAVTQLLVDWSQRAQHEVRVAHPGGGLSEHELQQSFARDMHLLSRGVPMRVLLQHAVRSHPPTRHHVSLLAPAGAKFRTVATLPGTLIIFDRQVAFAQPSCGRHSGVAMIRHSAVIEFLLVLFEFLWVDGKHLSEDTGEQVDDERDVLWQAILDQLAAGAKDDAIAHRLGLSVRTCRRHIAAMMKRLDADSRFQAGVQACHRGMVKTN